MLRAASTFNRLLLVSLAAFLALPGCRRDQSVVAQVHVFGSPSQIEIRGVPPQVAQAAIANSADHLNELHRQWHAWEPSDLTRINAAFAGGQEAVAPVSILDLIRRSQVLKAQTDGLFDPGVGSLVALWGFHTSQYPVATPAPSRKQVAQLLDSRPSISDVRINGERVSSRNPAVSLDFGAIAEGVAAQQVTAILRRKGVSHALISMGGDAYALGDGDGHPWQVDMNDPFGGVLGGVELGDGDAFFTSGNYNKFRRSANGGRWGHVLNPRTGMPALGTAAVAVLHRDPVLADAASTALMAGGPSRFFALVTRMKLGCALMLTEENELLVTAGMKARMHLLRQPVALGEPIDLGMDCGG